MNLIDCDLIDIMQHYFVLHYHGKYSNRDIDEMYIYEAEYNLMELQKVKNAENEPKKAGE
jgi:hypothetical protein